MHGHSMMEGTNSPDKGALWEPRNAQHYGCQVFHGDGKVCLSSKS